MEQSKFKGNWHEFNILECEGNYEKFLGMVQKRYGDRSKEVQQWATDWYSEREQQEILRKHATVSRNHA